jgi:hypothetical protein
MSERRERCDRCRFWERAPEDSLFEAEDDLIDPGTGLVVVGTCQRYPPSLDTVALSEERGWRLEQTKEEEYDLPTSGALSATVYPVTAEGDWCGEFREAAPPSEGPR